MIRRFVTIKLTRVDVLISILVCLLSLAIVQLACSYSRDLEYRITCQNNLYDIGIAMQIYANDNDGEYPRAGGPTSQWACTISDWMATDRYDAYQIRFSNGSGGFVTITSCFYLLIKYAGMLPDSFVCPGDSGVTEFNPLDTDMDIGNMELPDFWDFGPYDNEEENPTNHCSYAYHMPFGQYALTTSSDPGVAVAADKNPWIYNIDTEEHFSRFDPDGDREAVKAGNAIAHFNQGQNVLFVDGHVSFETESFCGLNNDNIYTCCNDGDSRIGSLPEVFISEPTSSTDSFLANEPGKYQKFATKQSTDVNSINLQQTLIVASLDCPIPEQKNVIWCSAFQAAWDKLRDEIIGEPVEVIGAEDLTTCLNQAIALEEDLDPNSYYSNAGLAGEGIIEQIQTDMNQCFPSEPVPFSNEDYNMEPNSILAYSYMNLDIEYKYPFYNNSKPFTFVDSNGTSTEVASFCNFLESEYLSNDNMTKQAEVLFWDFDNNARYELAIDLCKHTQPYQVILALISREIEPRQDTLDDAIDYVESKTAQFKLEPIYEELRELFLYDGLIVPDFVYKMTHHFSELEGGEIANQPWQNHGYQILEAMQIINFSINRTSVVIESNDTDDNRLSSQKKYYFNRPFLIYVKKRGEGHSPIFAMWVDNAEMMTPFQGN